MLNIHIFIKKFLIIIIFFWGIISFKFVFATINNNNIANNIKNIIINIIHTNDIHGNFESVWNNNNNLEIIGLDIIKSLKNNLPNSILVDAGDAIQGSAICLLDQESVINLINEAKYDIRVPGNHDFDFSTNQVVINAKKSNCPVLAANVLDKNNIPVLNGINKNNGENYIININGKKLGFFGLVTTETAIITPPENILDIKFEDEIKIAKEQVKKLKKLGADIIIAVTHMGVADSTICTSEKLAQEVDGIDIIIDGHSHTVMSKKINNTVIQQTGVNSHNIGIIEICFNSDKKFEIKNYIMSAQEIGKKFTPDLDLSRKYEACINKFRPILDKPIGYLVTSLFGDQNISRSVETNLGDVICDSMIDYAKNNLEEFKDKEYKNMPTVAFMIGGGIRKTLKKGTIKYQDIIECMFHGNKISFQVITPKILYEILEYGVGKLEPDDKNNCFKGAFGSFPQVGGLKFDFDISKKPYDYEFNISGERIISVKLIDESGNEIKSLQKDDDKTQLILLSNSTMTYSIPPIANIEKIKIGDNLTDILSNYINKLFLINSEFNYNTNNNRVNLINNKINNFDSVITIQNLSGALAETEVEISIDNNLSKKFKTDINGKIYIKNLKTGLHIINIKYSNYNSYNYDYESEFLVSNFCDMKNINIILDNK